MRRRRRKSSYSSGLSFYEDKKTVNLHAIREGILWALATVLAIVLAVVCWRCFGTRVVVSGASMDPEIAAQQSVLVNRLAYQFSDPQAGDVIAFYPGGDENLQPSVKRVAAVPGDTVQIVDGVLLVNGETSELMELYTVIEDAGTASGELVLDEDEYFVLGDNPSRSEDSRSAGIGTVSLTDIIGKVWIALPAEEGTLHLIE